MRPFLRAGSGIELKVLNWHLLGAVRLSAHTAEAGIREGKGGSVSDPVWTFLAIFRVRQLLQPPQLIRLLRHLQQTTG